MKLYAFVPLVTYPDANSEAFAANAVALAAAIGASVNAYAIEVDIPDVSNTLSTFLMNTPEMIRQARATSRKRGSDLLEKLHAKAVVAAVEMTSGYLAAPLALPGESAAVRARYFDLSLVGWETENPTARAAAEAIVFGSGRPAILLPDTAKIGSLAKIAIAWDGSRVAARAVADARFLLERAESVAILTVTGEKRLNESDTGERLAEILNRQGVRAQASALPLADRPIAETLQQAAIERGCTLLVMGGYGHSRLRDFVLGGATRGVLDELLLPVLLSH